MIKDFVVSRQFKKIIKNVRYVPTDLALLPWNLQAPYSE